MSLVAGIPRKLREFQCCLLKANGQSDNGNFRRHWRTKQRHIYTFSNAVARHGFCALILFGRYPARNHRQKTKTRKKKTPEKTLQPSIALVIKQGQWRAELLCPIPRVNCFRERFETLPQCEGQNDVGVYVKLQMISPERGSANLKSRKRGCSCLYLLFFISLSLGSADDERR